MQKALVKARVLSKEKVEHITDFKIRDPNKYVVGGIGVIMRRETMRHALSYTLT